MEEKETKIERKSSFLATFQMIILGIAILLGIFELIFKSYIAFGVTIILSVIIFISLKIFIIIIDLLQSIDEKLENK